MSWTRNVRHPSKIVSIGETIEAVVLKVDPSEEKISLGMKQTEQDPWLVLPLKFPLGTRITGKVRNLTSFGAFVEIEPGIDGLIHISDMSWTKRVQHPAEVVKKNDTVDVVILSIDSDNKRISLGLKQAQEDPWLKIGEDYPVGSEHEGHVARFQDGGAVVDMGNDLEGFVPESQLPIPEGKSPESVIKPGQEASLKVMEVDPIHHRIIIAITELGEVPPEEEIKPELETDIEAEEGGEEADAAESLVADAEPTDAADVSVADQEVEPAEDSVQQAEAESSAEEEEPSAEEAEKTEPTDEPANEVKVDEAPSAEAEAEDTPTAEDEPAEKKSETSSE
jgi:small subunit ribosomal protein S1